MPSKATELMHGIMVFGNPAGFPAGPVMALAAYEQ